MIYNPIWYTILQIIGCCACTIIAGGRCWLYPKSLGAWLRFFQVLYNLLIKRYKIYIRNITVQITYILSSERFAFFQVFFSALRFLLDLIFSLHRVEFTSFIHLNSLRKRTFFFTLRF